MDILHEAIEVIAANWIDDIQSQITAALMATYEVQVVSEWEEVATDCTFPKGIRCFIVLFKHPKEDGEICNHPSMVFIYKHRQIAIDIFNTHSISDDEIIGFLLSDDAR
jgi:hypothetical protein